jgi:hypothetical protein
MITIKIVRSGLELKAAAGMIPEIRKRTLERLAEMGRESVASHLSGSLASKVTIETDDAEARIRPPWQAIFVEKGTKPHIIRPKRMRVLEFQSRTQAGFVLVKVVRHPGTMAHPFIEQVLEEITDRVDRTFTEVWKAEMPER